MKVLKFLHAYIHLHNIQMLLHGSYTIWKTLKLRETVLKLVESEDNEHVTIPWERFISMLIKLQPSLFHLLPYMLRKFDWENFSLNDFKARLASYRACPGRMGWMCWYCVYGIIWVMDAQRPNKPVIGLWNQWFKVHWLLPCHISLGWIIL